MKFSTKLSLIAGIAAGYVLGARAGRQRYEQIAAGAQKLWESKPVQKQADKVTGLVEQYVPQVVESGFSLLGKGASTLTKLATKSNRRAGSNRDTVRPPSGTVGNPAH